MFSCFKSLNKKFICSICSACLLCMTGISSLRAEGDPLTLGETTVESATVGTNAFLTNTLQDHVYSSRLLSIFSQKPFLYVDKDGNARLSAKEIPDQNKIPFGTGTSTSVFIAAVPVNDTSSDESYESDGSYYDDLKWYELDDNSWDKLCVRNSGTAKILYHVVSTDNNIKGTIDSAESLNIKYATKSEDIIYDDQFSPNAQMLGFRYQYQDGNGHTQNRTSRISMNLNDKLNADFTIDEFLRNVSNGNFILTGEVRQYDSAGSSLGENFEIDPTISSLLAILKELAEKIDNAEMISYIDSMPTFLSQDSSYQNDESQSPLFLSDGKLAPDIDSTATGLRFYTNDQGFQGSILSSNTDFGTFLQAQLVGNSLAVNSYENVRVYNNSSSRLNRNSKILIPSDLYSVGIMAIQLARLGNNDNLTEEGIRELMTEYGITQDNPLGNPSVH